VFFFIIICLLFHEAGVGIHDFDTFVTKFDLFVLVPAVLYKSGPIIDSQQRHRAHKLSDSSADKHDH
jgi:hypothetical protein